MAVAAGQNLANNAGPVEHPPVAPGYVSRNKPAPTDFADPLWVVVPSYNPNAAYKCFQWAAGPMLPAQGAPCVVVMAEEVPTVVWYGPTVEPWNQLESLYKNSWKNLEATKKGEYRRGFVGVELRGAISAGTTGTVAFILPTGFRPAYEREFPIVANGSTGYVRVTAAGEVIPTNIAGEVKTSTYLDPVRFSVD